MPAVWLVGTSGVGKSTVGWRLQQTLEARGTTAAFIDADQLRNVAGVTVDQDEFIAQGLSAIEPGFRRAGAKVLVVSGMVDDEAHLARLIPRTARPSTLIVHLRASDAALGDRVQKRGWNVELTSKSVDYAHRFDAGWVDVDVDTTGLTPAEVVAHVVGRVEVLIASVHVHAADLDRRSDAGVAALTVITGPGGVGLSTTGFLTFLHRSGAGDSVGYIDSHQVGLVGERPRADGIADLRARNTAALAEVMAERGVSRIVVSADPPTARELVTQRQSARVVWLDASDETILSRLRARAQGDGPPIMGDHRLGLSETELREALAASAAEARDVDIRPQQAIVVSTDNRSAEEIAAEVIAATTP